MIVEVRPVEKRDGYKLHWEIEYKQFTEGRYRIKDSNLLIVDRYSDLKRLANDLSKHRDIVFKRFERMCKYKNRYVLLEFSVDDFLAHPRGDQLLQSLEYLESIFSLRVLFLKSKTNAEKKLYDLLLENGLDIVLDIPTAIPINKPRITFTNLYIPDFRKRY